jgi:RimJ/RimL family protein N-acetyltransferase
MVQNLGPTLKIQVGVELSSSLVTLVKMTGPEFAAWKERALADYAADKVRAGNDVEDGAIERSKAEFDSDMPEGPNTKGHHFFTVVDERSNEKVGMVWYADASGPVTDMLWIYDIEIDAKRRGKGYGTAVMKLVEERARELGKSRVGLHVFAHNEGARRLYERLGYGATNIQMSKAL